MSTQSGSGTPPRKSWIDWRLMATMHLPSISIGFGLGATVVVMGDLSQSFGATAFYAVLAFVFHQLGTAVAPIPTGYFIDRVGRRAMLLAGPFVIAASSLLIVRALLMDGSFAEIIVYWFFAGVGEQMWMLSRITVIAETGGNQQRGKQITSMFGVQQFGNLTGPLVGGFTAVAFGNWAPFLIHAVIVVLAVIPSFFLVKETLQRQAPATPGGKSSFVKSGKLTWKDVRTPPIPYVFAAQFLANVTRGGVFGGGVMVIYASYAYGLDQAYIGTLRSIAGFVGIPITFSAGVIMDRFGRKFTIVPGLVLSGLAMFFLALTNFLDTSVAVFYLAFVLVHMAVSLISGNMQTLGTDVAPPHARGSFFGWSRLVSQGGSLVSQAAWGLVYAAFTYGAAFTLLASTAFAAAAVVFFGIPETLRKESKEEQSARAPAGGSGTQPPA